MQSRPPPAPEVPRGAPISYRGPGVDNGGLQRSFSQRARGRPYANEAFADYDMDAPEQDHGSVRPQAQSTYVEDYDAPFQAKMQPQAPLRVDTSGSSRPVKKGQSSMIASPSVGPPYQPSSAQTGYRRTSDTRRNVEEPTSGSTRVDALRDTGFSAEEQDRDWAPDRSPLQKLEVTLNDISKEEKRARVQQAEMLLREGKSSKPRQSSQRDSTSKNVSSFSTARGPRVSAGAPKPQLIEDPDSRQSSGDGRGGSEYQSRAPKSSTTYDAVTVGSPQDVRSSIGRSKRGMDIGADRPKQSGVYGELSRGFPEGPRSGHQQGQPSRSISDTRAPSEPGRDAEGSRGLRTVSMHQRGPQSQSRKAYAESPTERERNASHKAALEKLTGIPAMAAVPGSGSRKSQRTSPTNLDYNLRAQPPQDGTSALLPQPGYGNTRGGLYSNTQTQPDADLTPTQRNKAAGLGIQDSPRLRQPESSVDTFDTARQKSRRPSVSFKEPYLPRRPVDEWKQAGIARLTLADFVLDRPAEASAGPERHTTWWEKDGTPERSKRSRRGSNANSNANDVIDDRVAEFSPRLYLKCGPLLRYTGMKSTRADDGTPSTGPVFWRGSVMIVTQDSQSSYTETPTLRIFSQPKRLLATQSAHVTGEELAPEHMDPIAGLTKVSRTGRALYVRPVDHLEEQRDLSRLEDDNGLFESSPSSMDVNGDGHTSAATNKRILEHDGERVGRYQDVKGARLYADPDRDATFWRFNIEVELGDEQQHVAYRINRGPAVGFWVPARDQTMNIMFHSCNGFSLSVDSDQFSGPDPLWRDVLNSHQTRPFHVMIGGGDQIYNDRVMVDTRLFGEWTRSRNPAQKHHAEFTNDMKNELEDFYLERYAMWFSQGLFGMANSQIPMVNIWDDHDIIDGFGSYPDHFMRTPVFSGVGNVAFKYYMLFQHQSVPEETHADEPSWVLGHRPGPYITQRSRSVFMHMGKNVAFLGLDCRTERTRNEVLSLDTVDIVLDRCRKELVEGETKHLILLLGVPIAYPRLVWLENVFGSRAMDPIKALNKAGILKSGFLNKFDGGVEILDDLDDHWTASNHKHERNELVKELQDLAAERSVRITILGGDVHLAAMGQFYSNPKLRIPKDRDHRYMPNIISSAIVNTPPPEMLADMMNKRNKVHHLDKYTDENMIPMFTHDVNHKKRNNKHLLPRRNWCSIREYHPGSTPPPTPPETPSVSGSEDEAEGDEYYEEPQEAPKRRFSFSKGDANPRSLFRRLSSRKAPPSSYRDTMDDNPSRSVSYDGSTPAQHGEHFLDRAASRRDSLESSQQGQQLKRASSLDRRGAKASRPNFQRRPTNLSEKAARKGNVLAVDAEGNEFDVNDQVNLEGGLDIVLNCEVDQRDPAGITTPYRILIPQLWYDGSSDREKLDEAAGTHQKSGLLGRLGLGRRGGNSTASKQGAGNWGQAMSDTESYSGSEGKEPPPPRRRFSLFGNRRKKQEQEEYYSDEEEQDQPLGHEEQSLTNASHDAAAKKQEYHENQARNRHVPASREQLYDTTNRPPSTHNHTQTQLYGLNHNHNHNHNLYQSAPQSHQPSTSTIATIQANSQPPRPQKSSRRSFTISSSAPNPSSSTAMRSSSGTNTSTSGQPASYFAPQPHHNQRPASSQPQAQLQSHSPQPTPPQRQLSKQERVLGIGSTRDSYTAPAQHALRGNGILGNPKVMNMNMPPQSYRGVGGGPSQQDYQQADDANSSNSRSNSLRRGRDSRPRGYSGGTDASPGENSSNQGWYDGIAPYKEKPKRAWSLRRLSGSGGGSGRNWIGDGRVRGLDDEE